MSILPLSGERFIPGMPGTIELEHMHRYVAAMSLARGKRVLDLASGEGYGSKLLASVAESVVGLDISAEAVAHANETYASSNLSFQIGDCAVLPLDAHSFDLVVSFETIEHHDKHDEMLAEIARVLKPDGLLLISSPNKLVYSDMPASHNRFHVKELYLDELELLLRRYFPHVQLYGQRSLPTSLIAPLYSERSKFTQFKSLNGNLTQGPGIDEPVYYLALVGRSSVLPSLGISTYENAELNQQAGASPTVVSVFETKMFWRPEWTDKYDGYTEEHSVAVMYKSDEASLDVRLTFPKDCGPIEKLRIDILNAVGGVDLRSMALVAQDGRVIWQWDGSDTEFQRVAQAVLVPDLTGPGTCTIFSLGNDPWFELGLDDAIYEQIKPGCALILEVSPFHLLDRLPSLLEGLSKRTTSNHGINFHLPVKFVDSLGSLSTLVGQALSRRDEVIRDQCSQLSQLRDELTRAEAQLDLLKHLILGGRDDDRF